MGAPLLSELFRIGRVDRPFGRGAEATTANLFPFRLELERQQRQRRIDRGLSPETADFLFRPPTPNQAVIDAVRGAFRPDLSKFDFNAAKNSLPPGQFIPGTGGTNPGDGGNAIGLPQGVFDNARFGNLQPNIIAAIRGAFRPKLNRSFFDGLNRFNQGQRNRQREDDIHRLNIRGRPDPFIDQLGPGLQPAIAAGNRSGALRGATDFLNRRFNSERDRLLAQNQSTIPVGPAGTGPAFTPTSTPQGVFDNARFGQLQPNIIEAIRGAFRPQLGRSKGLAGAGLPEARQGDSLNTGPGFPEPQFLGPPGPTFSSQAPTQDPQFQLGEALSFPDAGSLPTLGQADTPGTGIFGSPGPIGGGITGAPIQGGGGTAPLGGGGGIFGGGITGFPIQRSGIFG